MPAFLSKERLVAAVPLAWTGVGLPLAWGVASTVQRALALFRR